MASRPHLPERDYETMTPEAILGVLLESFPARVSLACSFQKEESVLLDMLFGLEPKARVFALDTHVLFPETYALWRALEARYRITIRGVRPREAEAAARAPGPGGGAPPWEVDPEACCAARKVRPLRAELARLDAWISAIRRDQTPDRAGARPVEWDERFELVKVNPLVRWTAEDVSAYVKEHAVPVNPLHARGYPSIGCAPCTTPAQPGEDPRAGRWRGSAKKECGLHTRYAWANAPAPGEEPGGTR